MDPSNSLSGVTVEDGWAKGLIINFPATGSVYRWITISRILLLINLPFQQVALREQLLLNQTI